MRSNTGVLGMDGKDFCRKKAGMNRRLADRHIRGSRNSASHFDLAQLTPINASHYRQIAASVNQRGLVYKGETIAFTEQDAPRLTAAIAELSKAAESARKASGSVETHFLLYVLNEGRSAIMDN